MIITTIFIILHMKYTFRQTLTSGTKIIRIPNNFFAQTERKREKEGVPITHLPKIKAITREAFHL